MEKIASRINGELREYFEYFILTGWAKNLVFASVLGIGLKKLTLGSSE